MPATTKHTYSRRWCLIVCPALLRLNLVLHQALRSPLGYSSVEAADAGAAVGHRVEGNPGCPPVVPGGFVWLGHPSLLCFSECASYASGSYKSTQQSHNWCKKIYICNIFEIELLVHYMIILLAIPLNNSLVTFSRH